MTPAEIWEKLTPSQRVTLLVETHPYLKYSDLYKYGDEALVHAGLKLRGRMSVEQSSGSARHALGRKGLLDVGQTVSMPTSAAGFHTPRKPTPLGRVVAGYGVALLEQPATHEGNATLRPGDEVKYTSFTVGGAHEGTAIVTWDHGKSVEARTLGGDRLRLERAADGTLRRFT